MDMLKQHVSDLTATFVASVAWFLAQAAEMPEDYKQLLENSILASLVLFFVWTSWQRESRMAEAIRVLEEKNAELLKETLKSIDKNNDLIEALGVTIQSMQKTMGEVIHDCDLKPKGNS